MAPRSWLSSCALNSTVRPSSRDRARGRGATTTCCWCGSRLISGSSRRRRRGLPISASASSRRWRSPPDMFGERTGGERVRADRMEHAVDLAPRPRAVRIGRPKRWPSIEQARKSRPESRRSTGAVARLRQVADGRIAARHRSAEDADRARAWPDEAEHRLDQRRLAGAVGAEHADEFALGDVERDVGEDRPAADRERDVLERDRAHVGGRQRLLGRVDLRLEHPARRRSCPAARSRSRRRPAPRRSARASADARSRRR